jgi:hypothetical protein
MLILVLQADNPYLSAAAHCTAGGPRAGLEGVPGFVETWHVLGLSGEYSNVHLAECDSRLRARSAGFSC